MKTLLLFTAILLTSCSTIRPNVVTESALINAHDYKYIYVIGRKTYKSNVCYTVGDTLSKNLPQELLRIK